MKATTDSCLFGAWVASDLQKNNSARKLLDIGAGTGLLSLMIAQKNTKLYIDAIEIDNEAASQALENSSLSVWKERIKIINSDARDFKPKSKYDIIISNPPFYENELPSENKQRNIAHHSEELSLDDLLKTISKTIYPTGSFYLLLPYKRNDQIENLLSRNQFCISQKVLIRQSVNHNFFRIFIKAGLQNVPIVEEEISIRDNNQQYTKEFTNLLKEYYLNL